MTETDIKQNDDNTEDGAVGILCGSVGAVYSSYQKKARETGKAELAAEDFWNRFRRHFPGSDWVWANYGTAEESCVGRAVFVGLRTTDTSLGGKIDKWGWFTSEGHDAVLEAFIRERSRRARSRMPSASLFSATSSST